ncbi:hypothetical protein MKW98_003508 [Papaver atlanticum]|uniref:Uncharacterized protein n=1 Tax=Papaver atlanticum TaxID=357466 RepID=A0AAD4XTM2_9MAGN|nr:hypothetical protein MKW98_003508 [Papaver atlanticum]
MIPEKPNRIKREGMQIFSVNMQLGGLTFATCGGEITRYHHLFHLDFYLDDNGVVLGEDGVREGSMKRHFT